MADLPKDEHTAASLAAKLRAEIRADLAASLRKSPPVTAPAAGPVSVAATADIIAAADGRPALVLPKPTPNLALPPALKAGVTVTYRAFDSGRTPGKEGGSISGSGLTNANVNFARNNLVSIDVRKYFTLDPNRPRAVSMGCSAVAGSEVSAGIYWIHPALLGVIMGLGAPKQAEGVKLERVPFEADGQRFNAVRIAEETRVESRVTIYDSETGFLLSQNSKSNERNAESQSYQAYVSRRELRIPWADRPAPDWVGKTRELKYEGSNTLVMMGTSVRQSVTLEARLEVLEPGALLARFTSLVSSGPGYPLERNDWEMACAGAMLYPLWIDPSVLRELQPHQPIDEDPVTKFRMSFLGIEGDYASIRDEGPMEQTTFYFDVRNGMFSGFRGQRPYAEGAGTLHVETWLKSAT